VVSDAKLIRPLDKRAGGSRTAKVRESLKDYGPLAQRSVAAGYEDLSFLSPVSAKRSPRGGTNDSKLIRVVSG
jgi:hypothetical protein